MLKTTTRTVICAEVMKNLLSAQKRIAETGDAKAVIRISRYILSLAKEHGDVLVEVISEEKQQRSDEPEITAD